MTTLPLPTTGAIALGAPALRHLRAALERDTGAQGAVYLQQAGFASGEAMAALFSAWLLAEHGADDPGDLDAELAPAIVADFFREAGWGTLTVTPLVDGVLAFDSPDWAEADPTGSAEYPSCHFSSGLLADFLGRVTGAGVAVMEVECRSRGDARCRFLAGGPDSLTALYQRMAAGETYAAALGIPA